MSIKITIDDVRSRFDKFNCELVTSIYLGWNGEYEFICNKHRDKGVQKVKLRNLNRGLCCHYCSMEHNAEKRKVPDDELKKITENAGFEFVNSELIDGTRYIGYRCKKHLDKGKQLTSVYTMRNSKGKCPYCLNRKRTTDDFKNELFTINPNIEILGEFTKVEDHIKCRCKVCGNTWNGIFRNLLNGASCPQCARENYIPSNKHTQKWFDDKMKMLHPNIQALTPFVSMKSQILCKCKIDENEWATSPDSLLNGQCGCPICANKLMGLHRRKSNDEFIEQLKKINPNIIPLEDYKTDHEKILCKCSIHNYKWYVAPNKILRKYTGCPKCASYHNENIISNILDKWGYEYVMQKRFPDCKDTNTLPFDFYIPKYNIVIEYDGEHHYMPIFPSKYTHGQNIDRLTYIQKHDKIKNDYCKSKNMYLIRIPYWERDNIEYILFDELVKANAIEKVS